MHSQWQYTITTTNKTTTLLDTQISKTLNCVLNCQLLLGWNNMHAQCTFNVYAFYKLPNDFN